jgi:hypothetical protein
MFVSEPRSSVPLFSCPLIKTAYPKGSILSMEGQKARTHRVAACRSDQALHQKELKCGGLE